MRLHTQMAVLIQVWKLIEMLAPKQSRDVRFDCQPTSPPLEIRLEREFGEGESDHLSCEFPAVSLFEQKIDVAWKWEHEKGNIMQVETEFKSMGLDVPFPAHFCVKGLQHGDEFDYLSLVDVQIRVPKAYLMCK
jgi:hypothetical protein